jgi:hypothetical protein
MNMILFTLKEIFYICVGLMLIAFAFFPWIIGETSLVTIPITIVLLVLGGYISKRGIINYFQRASGSSQNNIEADSSNIVYTQQPSQTICDNCSRPIDTGDSFCGNCGAPIQRLDTSEYKENEEFTRRARDQIFSVGKNIRNKIKRTDVSQVTEHVQTKNIHQNSGKTPKGKLVAVVGTMLIILSGFLPWAKSSSDILKGFGDPILYMVIILAVASLIFVQFKNIRWAPLISGILATAFGFWTKDPEKLASFMSGFSLPDIKYGLYVYILGSLMLFIGGILGILKK